MTKRLILSITAALLMCAQTAIAQEAGGTSVACKTDIDTLCKDAADGRAKYKCLKDNDAKLSAGCKTAMTAAKQARDTAKVACKTDRETICKDAGDEKGAGMKCLRENAAKVSPDCNKALAALPQRTAQ